MTLFRLQRALPIAAAACLLLLSGCRRSSDYNILGSFFPAWLLCGVAAIFITFGIHLLLQRLDWQEQLSPPLVIYPALATAICLALWLVLFS